MVAFCSQKHGLTISLGLFAVVGYLYWSVAVKFGLITVQNGQHLETYPKSRNYFIDGALQQRQLEKKTDKNTYDETDLISMTPIEYLPNYKNPCWYESTGSGNKTWLRCLPYFFIAGFAKCATTDLFARLVAHPEIVRSLSKETHWWSRLRFRRGNGSIQQYAELQSWAAEQIGRVKMDYNRVITVDGSASTAWYNFNWRKIPQNDVTADEPRYLNVHALNNVLPEATFIFIMREPGGRLYSEYLYLTNRYGKDVSPKDFHGRVLQSIEVFKNCTQYRSERSCVFDLSVAAAMEIRIYPGLYALYLGDWFQTYSREQLFFLRTEDYGENMPDALKKIFSFLGVAPLSDEKILEISSTDKHNTRRARTSNVGPMWEETRTVLNEFYAPYNERLAKMLKNDNYLWPRDL